MRYGVPLLWIAVSLAACKGSSGGGASAVVDEGVAQDRFGQPDSGQIRPGVEIIAGDSSCTSNFIFALNASTYYIGTAAHCFSPDTNSGVDPCEARSESPGYSDIRIENATRPGELVYSSWLAMQQSGESPGSDICAYNDFALIRIHPDDIGNVHPAAVALGGPTAMFSGAAAIGDTVYSYGRSPFHAGIQNLQTREGQITSVQGGGWFYRVRSDNPGVSGDSGSAVLHESGAALGVLSDIGVSLGLQPVTNGVVGLSQALNYAKTKGFIDPGVELLTWPEFTP